MNSVNEIRKRSAERFIKLGKPEKAVREYELITRTEPGDYNGWVNLINARTENFTREIDADEMFYDCVKYVGKIKELAPAEVSSDITARWNAYLGEAIRGQEELLGDIDEILANLNNEYDELYKGKVADPQAQYKKEKENQTRLREKGDKLSFEMRELKRKGPSKGAFTKFIGVLSVFCYLSPLVLMTAIAARYIHTEIKDELIEEYGREVLEKYESAGTIINTILIISIIMTLGIILCLILRSVGRSADKKTWQKKYDAMKAEYDQGLAEYNTSASTSRKIAQDLDPILEQLDNLRNEHKNFTEGRQDTLDRIAEMKESALQ